MRFLDLWFMRSLELNDLWITCEWYSLPVIPVNDLIECPGITGSRHSLPGVSVNFNVECLSYVTMNCFLISICIQDLNKTLFYFVFINKI